MATQPKALKAYWANKNKKGVTVDKRGMLRNSDGSLATRATYDKYLKSKKTNK